MPQELTKLVEKLTLLVRKKFHGNLTISWANGVPKKLRIEAVEDL